MFNSDFIKLCYNLKKEKNYFLHYIHKLYVLRTQLYRKEEKTLLFSMLSDVT